MASRAQIASIARRIEALGAVDGVVVSPGETKELPMPFTGPGVTPAGCHIPGHYPAGMRATIPVAPPTVSRSRAPK